MVPLREIRGPGGGQGEILKGLLGLVRPLTALGQEGQSEVKRLAGTLRAVLRSPGLPGLTSGSSLGSCQSITLCSVRVSTRMAGQLLLYPGAPPLWYNKSCPAMYEVYWLQIHVSVPSHEKTSKRLLCQSDTPCQQGSAHLELA